MAGVPVEPHQGVRPIGSTGDQGSQLPNHFLNSGDPGLIRFTHMVERPYTLSDITPSLAETSR